MASRPRERERERIFAALWPVGPLSQSGWLDRPDRPTVLADRPPSCPPPSLGRPGRARSLTAQPPETLSIQHPPPYSCKISFPSPPWIPPGGGAGLVVVVLFARRQNPVCSPFTSFLPDEDRRSRSRVLLPDLVSLLRSGSLGSLALEMGLLLAGSAGCGSGVRWLLRGRPRLGPPPLPARPPSLHLSPTLPLLTVLARPPTMAVLDLLLSALIAVVLMLVSFAMTAALVVVRPPPPSLPRPTPGGRRPLAASLLLQLGRGLRALRPARPHTRERGES